MFFLKKSCKIFNIKVSFGFMSTQNNNYDVLIIGSGAAGLSLALRLTPTARIAVIAKARLQTGNTNYAQGGISAVIDPNDSI
jgi:L-aspartate oxidase